MYVCMCVCVYVCMHICVHVIFIEFQTSESVYRRSFLAKIYLSYLPILLMTGNPSSFVFRKSRVPTLARSPAMLTEVFYGFPQNLKRNRIILP
jgi:hypothetical protein